MFVNQQRNKPDEKMRPILLNLLSTNQPLTIKNSKMKNKILILNYVILAIALYAPQIKAQPKTATSLQTKKLTPTTQILAKYNLSSFAIKNLSLLKNEDPMTQMRAYSPAPNRGATPPAAGSHPAKNAVVGGIKYTVQTVPFSSAPVIQHLGSPVTETSSDGVRICERVRTRQEAQLEIVNNYGSAGNIAPGMIFSDQSVLNGTFTQIPTINRKAFSLTTD